MNAVLAVLVRDGRGHNIVRRIEQLNGHARQQRLARLIFAVAVEIDVDHAGDAGRRLHAEVVVRGVDA